MWNLDDEYEEEIVGLMNELGIADIGSGGRIDIYTVENVSTGCRTSSLVSLVIALT